MKHDPLSPSPLRRPLALRRWHGPAASCRSRGAAYVEAIVLVFFLIIIFTGVVYLSRYFHSKQQALAQARRCAWHYSRSACVFEGPGVCGTPGHMPCIPEACRPVLGEPIKEANQELEERIHAQELAAQGMTQEEEDNAVSAGTPQGDLRAGVRDKMGPFLQMIVGESLLAVDEKPILRTPNLPNAPSEIAVAYYLPCNLRHEDPLEVAWDLFQKIMPGF